jgi:hypothetical protein
MASCLINSAALYFDGNLLRRVPTAWLSRATEFFSKLGVGCNYFDVSEVGSFSREETYDFAVHRHELIDVTSRDLVTSIGLYANPVPNAPRSAWQAMASIEVENGLMFLGVDHGLLSEPVRILQSAYELRQGLFQVGYGIAYEFPLANGPDCYASGIALTSLADLQAWLGGREDDQRRLDAWRDEINGPRRYLVGMFRGAYRASILSKSHFELMQRATRGGSVPGKLSSVNDGSMWIWELTPADIRSAEEFLRRNLLLIE